MISAAEYNAVCTWLQQQAKRWCYISGSSTPAYNQWWGKKETIQKYYKETETEMQ